MTDKTTIMEETSAKGNARIASSFFHSIRDRLFLLLTIVLVPAILVQLLIYRDRLNTRKEYELRTNMEVARATAKGFEDFIQNILIQERGIAFTLSSFHSKNDNDIQSFLDGIDRLYPNLERVLVISPAGRVVASSRPALVGIDVADRSYFREISDGKEWAVSKLLRTKEDGRAVFVISSPVRDESGARIGVIAVSIDAESLKNLLSFSRFGGDVSILDKTGRAVYRYPETKWKWEDRDFAKIDPQVREALSGKEVLCTSRETLDKKLRIYAMAPIPSIGWVSRASIPEADAMSEVFNQIYRNASLFFLVLIGSFFIAVLFSKGISVPIRKLGLHVRSLQKGEDR